MPVRYTASSAAYKNRREELQTLVKKMYPEKKGLIMLFAQFEPQSAPFKQDPSFYYYTGVHEPAAVLTLDVESGKSILFVPNFGTERVKWIADALVPSEKRAHELEVDALEYLGDICAGYTMYPFFEKREYANVLDLIKKYCDEEQTIFVCNPFRSHAYVNQKFMIDRITHFVPELSAASADISSLVALMRRKKSHEELELMYKAITITSDAQETAAQLIKPNVIEYEVQAGIEYTFIASGGSLAFPSIVGAGINSTILHYHDNNATMKSGDLVVVDIGAQFNAYCADLTRTYPVSGSFTKRQREIYDLVLDTQEYIASVAKPGMWLSHKDHPEQSLNHLAKKYLQEKGYGDYFLHGIGHFLGLDVHDVGDYTIPLQTGDVITIEPGIYIAKEALGVRIEDNYWVVDDGVVCLSENLPKTANEIEAMMKNREL